MTLNFLVFPESHHDHGICLAAALKRAQQRCVERHVKWTDLRASVFFHLAKSHKPLSTYDLIASIAAEGKRLSPVSAYRILDVLRNLGLVHRLESRNAYFACLSDHADGANTLVFHCEDCEQVAEKDAGAAIASISASVDSEGFQPKSLVLEVRGVCGDCAAAASRGERC